MDLIQSSKYFEMLALKKNYFLVASNGSDGGSFSYFKLSQKHACVSKKLFLRFKFQLYLVAAKFNESRQSTFQQSQQFQRVGHI